MATFPQKAIKYLIFITNFLIFALSVAVIGYSGYFLSNLNPALTQSIDIPKSSVGFLLAIAVFAGLVSFFGCCGAIKENTCFLQTYGWILFVLLVAEFVAAGFVYEFRNDIGTLATEGLNKSISNFNHSDTSGYQPIEDIQKSLQCCGINSYSDWHKKMAETTMELPDSCCHDVEIGQCSPKSPKLWKEPCLPKFEEMFSSAARSMAVVGIIVAIIQFTAVVSSCCLARAFKRQYEVV